MSDDIEKARGQARIKAVRDRALRAIYSRHIRRAYRAGNITTKDHDDALHALKNREFMGKVFVAACKAREETGGDTTRPIIEWIQENWMEIVRVIISLLPLLLI